MRVATAIAVGVLVTAVVLLNMPPLTKCEEPPVPQKGHWFSATQVVVQPWLGRHHVYGIFSVPEQYKFDHLYTAKLTIQGIPAEFQAGSPEDEDIRNGQPEPGYYVKRVYLSTRTALWFLLTGRFGNVKASCHWWLILTDRLR